MRTIKFRGKGLYGKHKGQWVYGYYSELDEEILIYPFAALAFPVRVDPETIGQFTGLRDKNNKDIYEGDIIRSHPKPGTIGVVASVGGCSVRDRIVIWLNDEARFSWQLMDGQINSSGFSLCKNNRSILEVIGTIHDKEDINDTTD